MPRDSVPGDRQRLQPATRKLDQVLLQRLEAERVLDFEVGRLAVGTVGVDEVPAVAAEEARRHPVLAERRAVEVPADAVAAVATYMALACCEPACALCSLAWQSAHAASAT